MPAMQVSVRWPDGSRGRYYSPSTVVRDFLVAGGRYPLAEFVVAARRAMQAASERVRAIYGMPCGRAAATLHAIESRAATYDGGEVTVEHIEQEAG